MKTSVPGHVRRPQGWRLNFSMPQFLNSAILLVCIAGAAHAQTGPPATPLSRLQSSIERVTKNVNATWGIYIKSLQSGEEIALGADRQMDTMSVIKIPIMVEVFERIRAGKMALADKYTLRAEDILPGTGVMRSLDAGAVFTIKALSPLMTLPPDTTATDVLYRMVGGPEAVNKRMAALGLKMTRAPDPARSWFEPSAPRPARRPFIAKANILSA